MTTQHTSEIHQLLKLGDQPVPPSINGAPESLPIEHGHAADSRANLHENEAKVSSGTDITSHKVSNPVIRNLKSFLIYPVIFIFAFIFFYAVLNFSSLTAQVQGFFAKPQDQEILGDQLQAYRLWINGYFYAVTDAKLLDPNNDIDKDGLSNMDEFIMRTNPTLADSDSDGYHDGMEIINSYNPWGAGKFTPAQKELADTLDLILINNRISYNLVGNKSDDLASADTLNYDLNKPGRLSIPRLNMAVDLIWSKDPVDFETDLTRGVIHYPGTALPGQLGTIYVSGHSSDYIWKRDPMQSIFARINVLKPGDDVFVDVYGLDGKVYNYRYQVTGSNVHKPDDQTQFIDNSTFKLNLSTCWPIGTTTNRIVVSAVQVAL